MYVVSVLILTLSCFLLFRDCMILPKWWHITSLFFAGVFSAKSLNACVHASKHICVHLNVSDLSNSNVYDHQIKVYLCESEPEVLIKLALSFAPTPKIPN